MTIPQEEDCSALTRRLDKDLWKTLRNIIFEDGYLCYHDDDGCHYVLREIVNAIKKYELKKMPEIEDKK